MTARACAQKPGERGYWEVARTTSAPSDAQAHHTRLAAKGRSLVGQLCTRSQALCALSQGLCCDRQQKSRKGPQKRFHNRRKSSGHASKGYERLAPSRKQNTNGLLRISSDRFRNGCRPTSSYRQPRRPLSDRPGLTRRSVKALHWERPPTSCRGLQQAKLVRTIQS